MLFSKPINDLEFKANGDEWEVSGYVSIFDKKDLGNDIVRPGAFKQTLKSGPKVRFLLQHDARMVLGVPLKLAEDKNGLFGRFKISRTKLGEDTHELIKDGALDSFSFGYEAKTFTIDQDAEIRYLDEVTLYEASLVSMPMQPDAVVTGFKDFLAGVGITDELSLAEKVRAYHEGMQSLLDEIRGLSDKSRPLNETKRQELTALLEMFSGLDDVRSDLRSVLEAAPSHLVESYRMKNQIAALSKRYGIS